MIIFLYGSDDYRREAKKREILAEFQKKRSDLGIGMFSFGEGSLPAGRQAPGGDLSVFEKFREFLVSQSLFQSAKMAVLEDSFQVSGDRLKELKKVLLEILENKNITVLISEKDKPVKAMDFLLKEPVVNQKFEFLKGKEWENFILREAKRVEVKITEGALRFLAGVYQSSTWGLVTELEKIQHLGSPSTSSGPRMEIHTRDLEGLGIEQVPNFWSLIWGFKNREIKERLWALEKVFGMNEPAARIFNILAYQLPEKLGRLAEYDLMVKSGKLEYEEALLDLVIE